MRFIDAFMSAESALKHGGFGYMQGGAACAHWDKYASSIKTSFDDVADNLFRDAVTYLVQHPPRKQVINDSALEWKEAPPPADSSASQQSLLMVRRVRNNLLHGGKSYVMGGADTSERNDKLVRSCLVVLNHAMNLNKDVRAHYRFGW